MDRMNEWRIWRKARQLYSHYATLPVAAKAAIWFAFGNLILKGIGLFSAPLFTRILPTEEYGRLIVFMASQEIILILATWTMPIGAYMRGLFKFKKDIRAYTAATLGLIHGLTVLCFTALWLLRDWFFRATGMGEIPLVALLMYLLVYPAYQCWLVRQRVNDRYRAVVAASILFGAVSVVIPLAAVLWLTPTAEVKYIGTLLGTSCLALFFYFPYANFFSLRKKWETVHQYWAFSIRFQAPSVVHSLSYLLLGQADRIMIGAMAGKTEAAYYSVAYTLAMSFNLFQSAVLQSFLPWQYKQLEAQRYEHIRDVSRALRYFIIVGILLYTMLAPEALRILFTKDYYEAIWCVPPVTASLYFLFLYSLLVNIEEYFEKTRYVMYVSIFCSLFNIGANYLLLPMFGYIACAYTTLASYVLFAIGHYIFAKRVIRSALDIPIEALFRGKELLSQGLAMIVVPIGILAFYPYPLARYGIIVLGVCFLWAHKNEMEALWSTVKNDKSVH